MMTSGFGGLLQSVLNVVRRIKGGSSNKQYPQILDEITVWVKLVTVNGKKFDGDIKGSVRIVKKHGFVKVLFEYVGTKLQKVWNDVHITVKRLK
jgi:hypothetical protein